MSKLNALERTFRSWSEQLASGNSLRIKNVRLAGIERLEISREVQGVTRYLRFTAVEDPPGAWEFEVLLGEFGNTDTSLDFDGRRGGDQQYVEDLALRWLFERCSWNDIGS
ncbi:hypothetical protein [Corallococcus sp. Z5C101001]|uniref:hypothetical protein n=1 Tax=Corallococcus sp. Z5C101001 TaxID=2596829 RepID=UPI00117D9196|nr:hypothetical protein [Corallococcus sp. Z5C101001]TSC33782.1 hypothetical protein FOF48_01665 [Corallococcus sp. Z5C101001]